MEINIIIKIDGQEVFNATKETESKVDTNKEYSHYARFFDESCANWTKYPSVNLMFLKQQQTYANNLLKQKGYLFLNEVYELIGVPKTKEGQLVGWIYKEENPTGDNYVDFGIFKDVAPARNFVNGYERSILLDFNVDGLIWDQIE